MEYLLDKDFPFGLEMKMISKEDIEANGLQIIDKIEGKEIIQDSKKLKSFFEIIESKCKNKRLWVMLAGENEDSQNWLPLQIASIFAINSDVVKEIKRDFRRMIPFDEKNDKKGWNSKFYNNIIEVKNGLDIVCQKYSKLREKCPYFAVAILKEENYGNDTDEIISKYQKKEIELAYNFEPLIWNPSPIEKKYLKKFTMLE